MNSVVVMGPESLPSTTKIDLPVPVKKFYQGEPLALGITQIFIGMIGIICGMLISTVKEHEVSYLIVQWMPYWSGILYIISGSLAVAAARNPRMPLVQSMLAMNVLSAVATCLGMVFLLITLFLSYLFGLKLSCGAFQKEIWEKCNQIQNFSVGITIIFTVFTILEFCIATSVASFGCKMLCRNTFPEKVVVIYQNASPASVEQHPPLDCKQSAIHP